jgi:rSAM/selenodomain-associated transferase 1
LGVDNAGTCAIAVMAKAPRPGHVKTRLQGVLQPDEAAALGTAFLRDTLGNLHAAAQQAAIAPFVAYAPAGQERRFEGLLPPGTALLLADGSNGWAPDVEGFGCVLLETVRALLALGYGAACVLAADSPTLPTQELTRAADLLLGGGCDAVLGPVQDGGYYVLGLKQPRSEPFAGIRWSTNRACADTRARLAAAKLRTVELRTWFDVDDPAALARLMTDRDGYAAPHTAAALGRLQLRGRLRTPA